MFHTFPTFDAATRVGAVEPTPLHAFVQDHLEELMNAVCFLAGRRGARLVARLAVDLVRDPVIGRAAWNTAREILAVLTLEHVHDPDSEEAARFASIDPADPRIEDICLLTDTFRRALDTAVTDHPPALPLRSLA